MHWIPFFYCRVRPPETHLMFHSTKPFLRMKALLFSLVRALEFDLAVPGEEIVARTSIVQRPYVSSHLEVGSQLPLLIKLHSKT